MDEEHYAMMQCGVVVAAAILAERGKEDAVGEICKVACMDPDEFRAATDLYWPKVREFLAKRGEQ